MAAAARSDHDRLAGEVELGRGTAAHGVAGQGPAVGAADVVAEDREEQPVRREARMEGEARELRQPRMQVVEVRDQLGGRRRRVVLERHQPAADQADEPAPRGRLIGEVDRLGELEAREGALDTARRRRLRRTDDARGRPRRAIRQDGGDGQQEAGAKAGDRRWLGHAEVRVGADGHGIHRWDAGHRYSRREIAAVQRRSRGTAEEGEARVRSGPAYFSKSVRPSLRSTSLIHVLR